MSIASMFLKYYKMSLCKNTCVIKIDLKPNNQNYSSAKNPAVQS